MKSAFKLMTQRELAWFVGTNVICVEPPPKSNTPLILLRSRKPPAATKKQQIAIAVIRTIKTHEASQCLTRHEVKCEPREDALVCAVHDGDRTLVLSKLVRFKKFLHLNEN